MRQNSHAQLRAYLSVDKTDLTISGDTLLVKLRIKNSGQTPAYDFGTWTRITVQLATQPFVQSPPPSADEIKARGKAIVGPGNESIASDGLSLADRKGAIGALNAGVATAYFEGKSTYKDAFGTDRFLEFRLRSFRNQSGGFRLGPAPDGNRAN